MQKRAFFRSLSGLMLIGAAGLRAPRAFAAEAQQSPRSIAFVYFSKTGHTASVAKAAQAMTGCDVFEVKTVKPYPKDYGPTTEVVKEEIEKGIVREIVPLQTWIKTQDFKGKLILTCNTHGGGGLMHTREDFEKLFADAGAKLGTHLTVFGGVDEDDGGVRAWLAENGLLAK